MLRGWDAATGQSWLEISTGPTKVLSVACCSQDCVAAGGSDNSIRLWSLATGEMIERFSGHRGSVAVLAADEDLLISGSYDTSVRIWQNPQSTDEQAVRIRLERTR